MPGKSLPQLNGQKRQWFGNKLEWLIRAFYNISSEERNLNHRTSVFDVEFYFIKQGILVTWKFLFFTANNRTLAGHVIHSPRFPKFSSTF